ncbi:hypothetical protein GGR56DRAFT_331360 [Xylariaceae sp. FL0804]|nr:hypothetical protein GGR56DRAFT_331360 [Xylariaceae sp. FL0804]
MDEYTDGTMDGEDVFPCKGCGEILEEGKAFELAGNRWHLDCFRCNTCSTLLDSDANLLLLGDGSLICNNCTYSCSACGDKIEDLAILTGDQAFCATCFRCRNCKRKIENLRYARTSQGIFCMSCHESLMARRRKKSKAAAQAKARDKDGSPMVTEKSLPALPPNAIPPNAFSNDRVDPESDTPTELSPRPRPSYPRHDSSSRSSSRPARSPERHADHQHTPRDGSLSLPPRAYRNNRNSSMLASSDVASNHADDQSFFIPVALDPSPVPSATSRSISEAHQEPGRRPNDKDYFSLAAKPAEKKADSQSSTPHIAFQEKGRQHSSDYDSLPSKSLSRKLSRSKPDKTSSSLKSSPSPVDAVDDRLQRSASGKPDDFKLQEAPRTRKLNSRKNSQSNTLGDSVGSRDSSTPRKVQDGLPEPNQYLYTGEKTGTPRSSQDSRPREDEEIRSHDSPGSAGSAGKPLTRKELPGNLRNLNGLSRPSIGEQKPGDSYMTPRTAPTPPSHIAAQEAASAPGGGRKTSPKLPRWSSGGDFSMDEDMARILGTDEGSSSILRRVSNAVRHGRTNSTDSTGALPRSGHTRSVSETARQTTSPRWQKSPVDLISPGNDVTSPLSLGTNDDSNILKRALRNSEQRVAELERQFSSEKDLKHITQKLEEKRKTVSVLDTQTEIMIRQLEVLAGYVERAKETKRPIDPRELEDSALREFVQKLEKLKQSMAASIEQLHSERDQLLEERNRAVTDRDRARAEFEQLVSKNAQLADLNNDLTQQIQSRFKNHSDPRSPSNGNGLGIYNHKAGASANSITLDSSSVQTGTTIMVPEAEEPVLEAGPTVVKIGKGQVKKFNWKKGSKAMAQNIAKGVNRTVVAFQAPDRPQPGMAGESIGLPYNMTVVPVEGPITSLPTPNGQNRQPVDARSQGFFGFKKQQTYPRTMGSMNSSSPTIAEAPTTLFGSDLAERADFERRQIPCVVTRCIEEVELRGMDMEGIYRKTGGNSQTKAIQEGFDKNENFDISDPDLDITAVTSALKQYFRKLPMPLLTYDVYDRVLQTNSLSSDAEKCAHLQNVFDSLPRQHKDCLEFLMFHLSRVTTRERENLMTPKNLAVVFAPTIMRDTNIEREMTDMHAKNLAVQFIIENSHNIFA